MMTVHYDPLENSLTISEDNQPRQGAFGASCEEIYLSICKRQIEHMQKQKEQLDAWLYRNENIDKPEWIEHKRLANSLVVKIEQIKDRMDRKSRDYGICEFAVPISLNLK